MMSENPGLVLEVLKLNRQLKMSLCLQDELAHTVRQYSQCTFPFAQIHQWCQEITRLLNAVDKNASINQQEYRNFQKICQLLWDHLLTRTVKEKLKLSSPRDLLLSLDEELISIPWELLFDGDTFLALKFNIGRSVRTQETIGNPKYRDVPHSLRMLILANPTGDLESSYQEGINLKNQFDRKRRALAIDFKSTQIDTLYVMKNLRDYDIVHFAGHCEYDPKEYKNTGWVFENGKFTVSDIMKIGETVAFPSLIFSNACQSAITATVLESLYHKQIFSLASAFLFAGVRHYIGTIRKIEDKMSLSFARKFYSQLLKGSSVGESVRLGRLSLIDEFGAHSVPWTSYILYGNPGFVFFRQKPRMVKHKSMFAKKMHKKQAAVIVISCFLAAGLFLLNSWLPTRKPAAYLLFMRSQKSLAKGNNEEAVSFGKQVIEKDSGFLAVYPQLANAYLRLGRRSDALKVYFEYSIASQKRMDKKNLASAYIGIGWVYQQLGEYRKAFDFYQMAIALSRQIHDALHEAIGMRRLAVWYIDKNEYDKALELLTKSSEINRERRAVYEHRYNLACDYFDIGLVFVNKDDLTAAKEFYYKSLRLFEKFGSRYDLSDCYFNMGEIYLLEKQYHKALDSYMQGLKVDTSHLHKLNLASDYAMIGELYMEMDNMEKAEEYFLLAVTLSQEINAEGELAAANFNLGILYKKKNRKNRAREYLRQAQDYYRLIDTPDYLKIKEELLNLDS